MKSEYETTIYRMKKSSYQMTITFNFSIVDDLHTFLNIFSLIVAANQHRANLPLRRKERSSVE